MKFHRSRKHSLSECNDNTINKMHTSSLSSSSSSAAAAAPLLPSGSSLPISRRSHSLSSSSSTSYLNDNYRSLLIASNAADANDQYKLYRTRGDDGDDDDDDDDDDEDKDIILLVILIIVLTLLSIWVLLLNIPPVPLTTTLTTQQKQQQLSNQKQATLDQWSPHILSRHQIDSWKQIPSRSYQLQSRIDNFFRPSLIWNGIDDFSVLNETAAEGIARMKAMPVFGENTIFISMAAYRDVLCNITLMEMFTKCELCNRVRVGLVEYYDPDKGDEICEIPNSFRSHMRVVRIHASQARGPTHGRYIGSKLWRGEQYFMQIDGHCTFTQGWDRKLLEMVPKMPNPKFIMSHYPVSTSEQLQNEAHPIPFICKAHFEDYLEGLFSQDSSWYYSREYPLVHPQATLFVGAGFQFAPSRVLYEIPFDPYYSFLFHGEEFLYSARAWTTGYELVAPLQNVISHVYGRKKFSAYSDHPESSQAAVESRIRARTILRLTRDDEILPQHMSLELEAYGLGYKRSMSDYEIWIGLNLSNRSANYDRCMQSFDWETRLWFHKDDPWPSHITENIAAPKPLRSVLHTSSRAVTARDISRDVLLGVDNADVIRVAQPVSTNTPNHAVAQSTAAAAAVMAVDGNEAAAAMAVEAVAATTAAMSIAIDASSSPLLGVAEAMDKRDIVAEVNEAIVGEPALQDKTIDNARPALGPADPIIG